jgi:enamine deaminase RidA (YjgF/YER057c/UK114 family)
VFVSGTAAIDEAGRTCCPGDAPGQIRMTLENVLAVLSDMRCSPRDVVQAMAYCKTPAVAERFAADFQATLSWPWVVVVCDICRDDLLFEVEVTAGRPAE